MRRTSLRSKPEYWLVVLALIGAVAGAAATYTGRLSLRLSGSVGLTGTVPSQTEEEASWRIQDEENTVEVFEMAKRGVVMVVTTYPGGTVSGRAGAERHGNGSGFFIDEAGHVVTNNHVIEGATAVEIHTYSGKSYKASVAGADRLTDLAVLSVRDIPKEEVFPLTLADSGSVRVGQKAIVLGSPLATGSAMGLDRSPTVTTGIISAKDRSMPIESLTKPNVNDYTIENLIQTDAAVNPGNSGGPLLDSKGRVVGVVTAIMDSATGIGFAIPADVVRQVIPELLKAGGVTRAYMGITYVPLDAEAKQMGDAAFAQLGLGVSKGALVTVVEPGGPAEKAGLRGSDRQVTVAGTEVALGGDIIVEVDGVEIAGSNLTDVILRHRPGDKVSVGILRDGKKLTLEVTLGSR